MKKADKIIIILVVVLIAIIIFSGIFIYLEENNLMPEWSFNISSYLFDSDNKKEKNNYSKDYIEKIEIMCKGNAEDLVKEGFGLIDNKTINEWYNKYYKDCLDRNLK